MSLAPMKQPVSNMESLNIADLDAVKASDETDTTKSRSTGTPPTSDTASSSSTLNEDAESPQYDDAILLQLARQLEYYFSQANLEKDTYVETLRKLNDSFVPVSILQRFSKVQAFAPIDTEDAIMKAASEFSSLLEVAPIDTKTGKRVEDESASASTILAVGTITREPLDNSRLQAVVPTTPQSPVQNTIIIREVDSSVTEEQVRGLFDGDCPPIQSLYLDVFNCWFVTLDTDSRDDMLYVMMLLRSQYLGDEPVKARLKSLVRQVDPTHAPGLPNLTPASSCTHLSSMAHLPMDGSGNKNKRKSKKKTKNAANNNNNKGNNNQANKKNQGPNKGNREGSANTKKPETQQPKPDMSAASFPALSDNSPKVEVVVDGMESSPNAMASDACSTATTMSSSSSSGRQQFGGYAAALLKAKPASVKGETNAKASATNNEKKTKTRKAPAAANKQIAPNTAAQVVVKPPVWGGGRSFADVLAR